MNPAEVKPPSLMSRLRRAGRGLGLFWLVFSIAVGGLAGPAGASHEALHEPAAGSFTAPHAHHQHADETLLDGDAGQACQPDPLCMAGCAHAASALPPLRLPTGSLLRSPVAASPTHEPFRSRAPERELRPPILPLNA